MPVKITCQCGAKYRFSDEWAGRQIECTTCKRQIQVPAAAAPQEEIVYDAPPPPQAAPQQRYAASPSPVAVAARGGASRLPRTLIAAVVVSVVGVAAAGGGMYLMNSQLKDVNGTLQTASDELKDLKQRAAVADELRTKLSDRLKLERENVTALKTDIDKTKAKQGEIRIHLAEVNARVVGLKQEIRSREADLKMTIADAKEGFQEQADDLKEAISELKTELAANTENTDQISTELNATTLELVKAQQKLKDAARIADNLQAQIDALPPAGDTFIDDSFIDDRTIIEVTTLPTGAIAELDPQKKMIIIPEDSIPATLFSAVVPTPPGLLPTGHSLLTMLDTARGTLTFHSYPNVVAPTFKSFGVTSFPVAPDNPGRYDFKHTEFSTAANKGKVFDFVVLDTFTGEVWHSTTALPGWSAIDCSAYAIPAVDSRFRLDVSTGSEAFTVTNIGPSLGPSDSWVNIIVGGARAAQMTAVP